MTDPHEWQQECQLRLVGDALVAGKSAIVDNTNLAKTIRRPYVASITKHGIRIRTVFFDDFEELAPEMARGRGAKVAFRMMPSLGCRRVWNRR